MIQIKHKVTGDVLLTYAGADLRGADLRGADLRGANLRYANLRGADLRGADLRGADLQGANLQDANLRGANLQDAHLQGANLRGANLQGANLQGANLQGANLQDANLRGANLQGAYLQGANLQGANLWGANLWGADLDFTCEAFQKTRILPEGSIIGWKKCKNDVIVKLRIPEGAKRSHAFGRKCRAEWVEVLEVFGGDVGISKHDGITEYRKGTIVKPASFSEEWQNECAPGIHFFITRAEAEAY